MVDTATLSLMHLCPNCDDLLEKDDSEYYYCDTCSAYSFPLIEIKNIPSANIIVKLGGILSEYRYYYCRECRKMEKEWIRNVEHWEE